MKRVRQRRLIKFPYFYFDEKNLVEHNRKMLSREYHKKESDGM